MDKEIQANQWWLDMWHERTSPLDPSSPNRFWEKEKEREKKIDFRERDSTLSLNFPTIGPSRSKVGLHCKSYVWVSVLGSFDKLREVGVFSYLFYSLAKSHFNG